MSKRTNAAFEAKRKLIAHDRADFID